MGLGCLFLASAVRGSQIELPRLFFKLLLDFDNILIGGTKGQDVHKIHLFIDLSMHTIVVLEHRISLKVFDTQLGVQGMGDIDELWHCLVPFLPQCGPSCI
jgi:hypothetical protein